MSNYDLINYNKLNSFIEHLPEEHRKQFKTIINEGQLSTRTSLQAFLDVADTAAWFISTTTVMWQASWLQLANFSKEVQSTVEDLPFDGVKLFSESADEFLHTLKGLI